MSFFFADKKYRENGKRDPPMVIQRGGGLSNSSFRQELREDQRLGIDRRHVTTLARDSD
jgi:hypothetical protein